MASPKAKPKARVKTTTRKVSTGRKGKSMTVPYDAKRYAGTVPAFASVVADDMKAWRDDR